ncbi:helix-turn-helix domain-containing protein [Mycetocola saprophilus]|uniref:helix-turn-helix domain-containing protein n=1 Tax=Mycetocola saprophilus TaxID=76636 RepID=UPI003BF2A11F
MTESQFLRGNSRLAEMLEDVETAQAVADLEARADKIDEAYARTLTMIREAQNLTQADIARLLQISQGAVSQLENRSDMLLSTLRNYIQAIGAQNPRLIVTVNGEDVEIRI